MDTQLRALADPTRRAILMQAWEREQSAGEIASRFSMTRPAVSQHLQVLVRADLLALRRDGTKRLYLTKRDTLASVRKTLEAFWNDGLADLKRAAEKEHAEARGARARPKRRP